MRNLKRALSLTLASVMLLGMMVVGAGAAGYPDVDEEDNVEAIEVLQAVQVMVGDENGNFDPDRNVSRTEMAVVMALLLDLDYKYYEASCPFWDVPTWARGYVGACYANKTIYGYNATTYGAADSITPVQAAAMMMRALGYFQYAEDTKDGFELSTVRQGTQIGIFDGVGSSATAPMTRNQVAKMALNALQSEMVSFTGTPGTQYTSTSGETLSIGYRAEYTPRTSTESKYNAIEGRTSDVATEANHKGQYYIQLGEQLYNGDLKLRSNTQDDFGRPSRRWEYNGTEIGTYVKEELIREEYTKKVTGKALYDLLGASILKDYEVDIYVDGVDAGGVNGRDILETYADPDSWFDPADLNRNNDSGVGATGNGVLTQVFVDDDKDEVTIAVINTYLARADEDYDERTEDVDVTVYGIAPSTVDRNEYVKTKTKNASDEAPFKLTLEDFPMIKDVAGEDPLLVTVAAGVVQTVAVPEVLANATISAFSKGSSLTTGGQKYDYADTAEYAYDVLDDYTQNQTVNLKDIEYNVYLDKYGYAIGVDIVEAANNYVFATAIERGGNHLANSTADVNVIFLDGTTDTVKVNMDKSDLTQLGAGKNAILNTWCTYSVNNSNVYTLKEVAHAVTSPAITGTGADQATYVPGGANNPGKIAQSWTIPGSAGFDIDRTHLSLNGGGSTGNYSKVYGNDDTVYLIAKLDKIDHDNDNDDDSYGVIGGVDSVTVGVRNADISVYTLAEAEARSEAANNHGTIPTANMDQFQSYGVYSVYDRDGYVIAAMVVGEDGANSRNLVWVNSDKVHTEEDNGDSDTKAAGDGMYTWYREVILNGEKHDLVEVDDQLTYLDKLKQNNWYQIRTNSNGEVIGIATDLNTVYPPDGSTAPSVVKQWDLKQNLSFTNRKGNVVDAYEHVTDIQDLEDSIEAYDDVIYSQTFTGDHPSMDTNKGNTLYVSTLRQEGIWINDDVKIILSQINNNNRKTTEYSGVAQLRNIVKTLNDLNGSSYNYSIYAVVGNTGATSVIIYDWTTDYNRPNYNDRFAHVDLKYTGSVKPADAVANITGAVANSAASNYAVKPEGNVVLSLKPGYTALISGSTYTTSGTEAGGITYTIAVPKAGETVSIAVGKVASAPVELDSNSNALTLSTVNAYLYSGSDVNIAGPWQPAAEASEDNELRIPDGQTVTVSGALDLAQNGIKVVGGGKLVVTGTFSTKQDNDDDTSTGKLNFEMKVYNLALDYSENVANTATFAKKVEVDNNMTVKGESNNTETINIPSGVTVTVGNKLVANSCTTEPIINLAGHLEVSKAEVDPKVPTIDGFDIRDGAANSLIWGGLMKNTKLTVGTATTAGNTTVGHMDSTSTLTLVKGTMVVPEDAVFAPGSVTKDSAIATNGFTITIGEDVKVSDAVAKAITGQNNDPTGTYTADTSATNTNAGGTFTSGAAVPAPASIADAVCSDTLITNTAIPAYVPGIGANAISGIGPDGKAQWSGSEPTTDAYKAAQAYADKMIAWRAQVMKDIGSNPGMYTIGPLTTYAFNFQNIDATLYNKDYKSSDVPFYVASDGTVWVDGWNLDIAYKEGYKAGENRFIFSTGKLADMKNGYLLTTIQATTDATTNVYDSKTAIAAFLDRGVLTFVADADGRMTDGATYTWQIRDHVENDTNIADTDIIIASGTFKWKAFAGITDFTRYQTTASTTP